MKEFKNNKELFRYIELYGKLKEATEDLLTCIELRPNISEPHLNKAIKTTYLILDKIKKIEDEYEVS